MSFTRRPAMWAAFLLATMLSACQPTGGPTDGLTRAPDVPGQQGPQAATAPSDDTIGQAIAEARARATVAASHRAANGEIEPSLAPRGLDLDGPAIELANADQVHELVRLGTGGFGDAMYSPDGRFLAVASPTGVFLRDPESLESLWLLPVQAPTSMAFSRDGRLIAFATPGGVVEVWDVDGGVPLRTLESHSANVLSVAFAPDGQVIVSGDEDGHIRLSDVQTGRAIREFRPSSAQFVEQVVVSADGELILAGSHDGRASMLRAGDGEVVDSWEPSPDAVAVLAVALSPDDALVFAGAEDSHHGVWDIASERRLYVSSNGSDVFVSPDLLERNGVRSAEFSPDGSLLAVGYRNGTVEILAVADSAAVGSAPPAMHLVRTMDASAYGPEAAHTSRLGVTRVSFAPEGGRLVSTHGDGVVRVWDVVSGDLVSDVKSLTDRVECLAVSPDDRLVAAGSSTGAVWLVDAVTGQVAKEAVAGSERVLVVAFAPSGDSLMAVDVGGNLRIWRLPDLAVSEELQLAHPPDPATSWMDSALLSSAAFSPSGQNVAFGWTDGRVSLWRMEGTELLWEGQGQEIDIDALAFSADEALLASGTNGGERRIWHVADGAMSPPLEAEGLLTSVTAAAFGPTDGLVAFTSLRGVDLCSSSDLVALRQLAAAEDPGRTAAVFSPDGQLLAAGGAHGQVDLWNVEEGSQVTVLSGHADYVLAAAFSPSGRYLATSSIDGTVRLWGVPSGSGLVLGNGS